MNPETDLVATTYMENGCDLRATAKQLDMNVDALARIVAAPGVRNYITETLRTVGLRKMDRIEEAMEKIIDKKMAELDELEMGSSKDIAELLSTYHKMIMDKNKLIDGGGARVNNTQINNIFENSSYGELMKRIVNGA